MDDTPELTFLIPALSGAMHFWLELDTVATFDSGDLVTIRSDLDRTSWDYWDGAGWVEVTAAGVPPAFAGNEARYRVQTPLDEATWYRRVRAGVL